ncbi:MAG: type IV pilus biogenesis/stability protein PilW [Pseudomonadales bacterium]|jgi:type IV pilus assembly protein PilF|nr:type IV pilus biogenesis/stability protein PilW [Pseudomonadales bacterium]
MAPLRTSVLSASPTRTATERRGVRLGLGTLLLCTLFGLTACNSSPQTDSVVTLPPSAPLEPAPKPERVRAQVELAEGYIEVGDLKRARATVERALELDPRSWEAHDLYGRIYQLQGDAELAERHFRLALRAAPDASRVRNDYGVFLYQQARYDDAVEQLRHAADDPDSGNRPVAYENLGLASLAAGDRAAARAAFARAVMLEERMAISLLELAELAFDDADYAQSATWYRRYRAAVGRQTPRSLWLGVRLARLVDDADAEASYALQLRNLFPYSEEYRRYREGIGGG